LPACTSALALLLLLVLLLLVLLLLVAASRRRRRLSVATKCAAMLRGKAVREGAAAAFRR
jgi:hypothetical protein